MPEQDQIVDLDTNPQSLVTRIINHRNLKEHHAKEETRLRARLQNILEEDGIDQVRTSDGHTAYIGKATDEYSVKWQSLSASDKGRLLEWARSHGLEESVNAASFSAFVRSIVSSGKISQEQLPDEITHYTKQNLNVRSGRQ